MIHALGCGLDDYMTKPVGPGEPLACLAERLRAAPSTLRFERAGLMLDVATHLVTVDGEAVRLTATEFALQRILLASEAP